MLAFLSCTAVGIWVWLDACEPPASLGDNCCGLTHTALSACLRRSPLATCADGKEADERFEEYVQEIEALGTTPNEVRVALLFSLIAGTTLLNVDLVSYAARALVSCAKRIDSRGAGIFYITAGCLSVYCGLACVVDDSTFFFQADHTHKLGKGISSVRRSRYTPFRAH